MKSRILSLATVCLLGFGAMAQQSESSYEAKANAKVGKMSATAFRQINEKGTRMVNAIKPTSAKLSAADQQLLTQVALGGMRQLAISQAVVAKATNDQVKMLAQSEVEEQTNIAAKLKEVATAKGATLPDAPDAAALALVETINAASGAEVDAMYLQEGGINGHKLLQTTMNTVKKSASDASLKAMATATLPVIKTHLQVSQDVQSGMNGGKKGSMK